jgi:hypothetical protein
MWRVIILLELTLSIISTDQAAAQTGIAEAKAFLKKSQDAYRSASHLGFRISYGYANAGEPGKVVDTLSGLVQMDKGRCRFVLAGTETLVTEKYLIQAMDDEKLIYLSAARSSSMVNPVQMMDSVFLQMDGVHTVIARQGGLETMTLEFPPGRMYTRIRMEADPATGYLQRITYNLQTAGLVGQEMIDRPGHSAPYQSEGQIDMIFGQYEKDRFGDSVFDEKNFFTRIAAGRFEPAGRYKDYHIFLASSNL